MKAAFNQKHNSNVSSISGEGGLSEFVGVVGIGSWFVIRPHPDQLAFGAHQQKRTETRIFSNSHVCPLKDLQGAATSFW